MVVLLLVRCCCNSSCPWAATDPFYGHGPSRLVVAVVPLIPSGASTHAAKPLPKPLPIACHYGNAPGTNPDLTSGCGSACRTPQRCGRRCPLMCVRARCPCTTPPSAGWPPRARAMSPPPRGILSCLPSAVPQTAPALHCARRLVEGSSG